ncbi:hypothetical protein CABS03_12459 [Colletotrichum abscissum]|uniref:F-box domain-containing protein n=1 Tax=Colletotrichum abscissum TaxID=1671311 RepID=A0A9Q0B8K2_9PEZI|nr:hypothetical protein CABS02_02744 [Colletotrichum abscissum]
MSRLKWTLDTLPRELLVNICEILYYDDRAPSLASFSAVNKTCRDAAIGILVRNIDFIIDDDESPGAWHSLHLNTLSCELMLRKNDLLSQVRQISIWGEPPTPGKDYANGTYLTENRYDSRQSGWKQGRMFAAEVAEDDARKMDDCNLVGTRNYWEGTAPGLQEVRVAYDSTQDAPYELHEISWSGAKGLDSCFPQHRKSLRTFHLTWDPQLSDYSLLCKWGRFIDFDALRILRLPEPLGPQGLELLDTYSFPFLKNLVLNIFNLSSMNDPGYERERLITQFIDRRTKLWTLEVIGWNSFHFGKLFSPSCSFALRTLDLQSNRYTTDPFNAQAIALIAQRWPLIEDLAIRVRRSKGDEEEMASYVALGKLRRLRKLSLRLMPMQRGWQFPQNRRTLSLPATAAPGEVNGDATVDRLNPNYREEYRDLLINVAMDETLACAIFHAISTEGGTFQHQNLEKLELRVDDWSWAEQLQGKGQEVRAFCSILGRPWDVRRDQRFNHRSEVSALLVGDKFNTWRATAGMVPGLVEGLLHEVFREIWPRAEGSGPEARHSWQTDWKSFPLSAYGHRS